MRMVSQNYWIIYKRKKNQSYKTAFKKLDTEKVPKPQEKMPHNYLDRAYEHKEQVKYEKCKGAWAFCLYKV